MTTTYNVGDAVRLKEAVGDPPSGDRPGGVYGRPGEKVIVRRVYSADSPFPLAVSHKDVTDGRCFGVELAEIEPWDTTS